MNRLKQGLWIVFEGIDGVGKSTLIDGVFRQIQKKEYPVLRTGEAGGTPLGREIRQLLDFADSRPIPLAEYLLFAADRAQHMEQVVLPALKEKKVVISDRSADSSLAYQGYGRYVDLELIKTVNRAAMDGAVPDAIFYLRLPVEEALKRLEERGGVATSFEKEERDFFERVARGFDEIFVKRPNVFMVDATLRPEQMVQVVIKEIDRMINGVCE